MSLQIPAFFILIQIILTIGVLIHFFKIAEEKENVTNKKKVLIVIIGISAALFLVYGLPIIAQWLHDVF